jgi:hypothetical protein
MTAATEAGATRRSPCTGSGLAPAPSPRDWHTCHASHVGGPHRAKTSGERGCSGGVHGRAHAARSMRGAYAGVRVVPRKGKCARGPALTRFAPQHTHMSTPHVHARPCAHNPYASRPRGEPARNRTGDISGYLRISQDILLGRTPTCSPVCLLASPRCDSPLPISSSLLASPRCDPPLPPLPQASSPANVVTPTPNKLYCTQPPLAEVTELLCPHHEGAIPSGLGGLIYGIRWRWWIPRSSRA